MPAHIPHTYRKPTGVYYFRYVFPQLIRDRFPSLGADLRFSLKTKSHPEAKLRAFQNVSLVSTSIHILECFSDNLTDGKNFSFHDELFKKFGIDTTVIGCLSEKGKMACEGIHAIQKRDFYMLMEQVNHTHSDGSITNFRFASLEQNINALALLKAKERYYSDQLIVKERPIEPRTCVHSEPASLPAVSAPMQEADFDDIDARGYIPYAYWDRLEAYWSGEVQADAKALPRSSKSKGTDAKPDQVISSNDDFEVISNSSSEQDVYLSSSTAAQEKEVSASPAPLMVEQDESDNTITFAALTDKFFSDNIAQGIFVEGDATLRKYRGYMKNVVEVVGADNLVHTLTPAQVMDIRNVILHYPKRRGDGGRQHRTLEDLLADPTVVRIKKDMASEYFDRFKAVLDHGCVLGYLTSNPADKVKIKKLKGRCGTGQEADDSRKPFSDEDLISILNGYLYHGEYTGKRRRLFDAHFWVPLIAMYTGMRVGEICQLQLSDIHTEGMRWHGRVFSRPYIQVCAEHESQRVKNQNATRKVPIHHRLIEIGFLEYVELRKRETRGDADQRLFRHMRYESHSKWGRVISRWFNGDGDQKANGYKHLVLDQQSQDGKVFHSSRHTVIDILRSTLGSAGKPIISALVGHEEEGSSAAYGDGYQLDELSKAMDTLRYSDEVEALVSQLRFDDYVQKMIRHGMKGSERNTRIRWPKKDAAA